MKDVYSFDFDRTLCNTETGGTWNDDEASFFSSQATAKPTLLGGSLLRSIANLARHKFIITGRPQSFHEATTLWLEQHGFNIPVVSCRPDSIPLNSVEDIPQMRQNKKARFLVHVLQYMKDLGSLRVHVFDDCEATLRLFLTTVEDSPNLFDENLELHAYLVNATTLEAAGKPVVIFSNK